METLPEWFRRHSRKRWAGLTLEQALSAHAGINQFTQKEQADALGFSAPFLAMVVRGRRAIPRARRADVAAALGVPESVLDRRGD